MTEESKKEDEPAPAPAPEPAAPAADAAADSTSGDTLTEEDLKAVEGIKERLKFFFSNANIRQDAFIRKHLTQTDEKSVPLDVMMRFNTIKKFSDKPAVVIAAAKGLSDLLSVDEATSAISRVVPFTAEMMKENIPLSLRVKNLPVKEEKRDNDDNVMKKYDVTVDEVRALFEKFGDVALVKFQWGYDNEDGSGRWNRDEKRRKQPTGDALIEFEKKEDCQKAAAAILTIKNGDKIEAKEKLVLPANDSRTDPVELDVMLLADYIDAIRAKSGKHRKNKDNRKRDRDGDDKEEEPAKYIVDWKPGCVIKLKGMPETCDREALLDMMAEGLKTTVEEVRNQRIYADYSRGQSDGAIRFNEPSDSIADIVKKLNDGELKVMDTKVEETRILEGDEEKKYWDDFIAFKTKQMNNSHQKKKGRRNNHRR
ncbi:MAG: hypothetical protein SGILL_008294 [Bacillariaceae sp.]